MQGLFNACACCCLVFCTIQRQIDDYIQVSSLSLSKLIMLVAWHFFWIKVYHKFHVINCVIVVLSCTVLWNVKNDWKLHVNYSKLILSFLKFAPLAQHLQDVYVFLKCTRWHHITYEKSKISRGWYPRTPFNSSGLRPSHSGFARKKSTFVKPATPVAICFLRHCYCTWHREPRGCTTGPTVQSDMFMISLW